VRGVIGCGTHDLVAEALRDLPEPHEVFSGGRGPSFSAMSVWGWTTVKSDSTAVKRDSDDGKKRFDGGESDFDDG
jgi:hypothetical protein